MDLNYLKQKTALPEEAHNIRANLSLVMAFRGVSLKSLSETTGITMANLSRLKTGKVRSVKFSTLSALCEALDCQPGDLIEYEPTPES